MSRELNQRHRTGKVGSESKPYEVWDQFLAKENGRNEVIRDFDIDDFSYKVEARHTNNPKKQALNHPAYRHHLRELVTYRSKNVRTKTCKYGKYRDGRVVRCIRSHDHHAKDDADVRKRNGNKYTSKRRQPSKLKQPIRRSPRIALQNK